MWCGFEPHMSEQRIEHYYLFSQSSCLLHLHTHQQSAYADQRRYCESNTDNISVGQLSKLLEYLYPISANGRKRNRTSIVYHVGTDLQSAATPPIVAVRPEFSLYRQEHQERSGEYLFFFCFAHRWTRTTILHQCLLCLIGKVGIEPTTNQLLADCSTTELHAVNEGEV